MRDRMRAWWGMNGWWMGPWLGFCLGGVVNSLIYLFLWHWRVIK